MFLRPGTVTEKRTVLTAVMNSGVPHSVAPVRCLASVGTSVWTTNSSATGHRTAGMPQMKASTTVVSCFSGVLSGPKIDFAILAYANNNSVHLQGSARIPPCPGSFPCDNRTCVNTSQVCNGVPDCPRGDDELVCGEFSRDRLEEMNDALHKVSQKVQRMEGTNIN